MSIRLNHNQVRFLRATAQRLMGNLSDEPPDRIIQSVVGLQAQDLPSAYLAVRARTKGVTESQMKQLHLDQATLAWTWCFRGTLHLITAQDARWLIPLLGPRNNANDLRRMRQLGWTEESARIGVKLLLELIHNRGDVTRAEMIDAFAANGLPHEGQAPVHLLSRAVGEGWVTSMGFSGSKPTYTLFEKRHGPLVHMQTGEAMAELARRYLSGFAPAGVKDFSNWSGLKMSEAYQAWERISRETLDVEVDDMVIQILEEDLECLDLFPGHEPALRLLPRFDTYLLGYASRAWTVVSGYESQLADGGIISATIMRDGLVVGIWKMVPGKKKITIRAEIFPDQSSDLFPQIEDEASDVGRFLDKEVDLQITRQPISD